MSELTVRDWMVIIGVLLIMAVLLDAWRRVRSDKYSRVKMKLAAAEHVGSETDEDIAWLKELPNGGARVVERGDLLKAAGHDAAADDASAPSEPVTSAALDELPEEPADKGQDDMLASFSAGEDESQSLDWLDAMDASRTPDAKPEPQMPGTLPRDVQPEVFMLNVLAREPQGFKGEDILHILLACDLRFGDMSFFHRHEFEAGKGPIQFSVANMMQPGVFDIDNMSDFTTPGLVFFLTLPGPEDMMKAFDYMLETAQAVARNLGGDVLDESRSVLTKQTMDHSRQQIRDLERRLLAQTS